MTTITTGNTRALDYQLIFDVVRLERIGDCGLHRIVLGTGFGGCRRLVLEGDRGSERQADVVANAARRHGSDCTADHVRRERLWRKRSLEVHRDRLSDS